MNVYAPLSESWFFLRKNFKPLLTYAIPFIVIGLLFDYFAPYFKQEGSRFPVVPAVISMIIYPFYLGGLLIVIDKIANGEENIAYKAVFERALLKWGPFLLVSLISGLYIVAGFFLLFIPGVFLLVRLYLCQLNVIFEDQPPILAIKAAFTRTKPYFWQMLGILLPVFSVTLALSYYGGYLGNKYGSALNYLFSIIDNLVFIYMTILQYRLYLIFGFCTWKQPCCAWSIE